MRNAISLLILLAVSNLAGAVELTLVADNTRSSSGTLSYQKWATCARYLGRLPRASVTTNSWTLANQTGSTATWDWDGTTLTATGMFQTTSHLSSNPNGSAVISDKTVDLVINTGTSTTTATQLQLYRRQLPGQRRCQWLSEYLDRHQFQQRAALPCTTLAVTPTCVQRTLGGDDTSTGNPRGLMSIAGGGGCDPTDGAYNLWTIVTDDTATGGQLILSNGIDLAAAGTHYMTFQAVVPAAAAVDDGPVDVLEATAELINVGANDTGFTDPVTITRTTPDPTKGTAVVTTGTGNAADVTITYTSNVGATGTDTFGYQITDGASTETATVTVNILPFGANDDSASTTRGVPVTVYPARNDAGYDPDTVTVTPGACTSGTGTIAVTSGNGGSRQDLLVTYTPPANNPASGSATTLNDSCAYTIGNGDEPDDTANILVAVSNSVPVANDGNASAISTVGVAPAGRTATFTSPGTGGSLGNAGVTTAGNGANGTTSVAGNVITYTAGATFFAGSDTFTYTVTDADGAASDETDTGTVTVTIADAAPAITVAAITTTEDTASAARSPTITLGNGSAAQHTLAVTTDGTNGSCVLSPATTAGTVVYTPNAGYTGADSCILTLTDGDGDAATATISVTVTATGSSGSGSYLPGGGGALDLWSLSLLGGLVWLRRKQLAWPGNPGTTGRGQG